MFSIRNKLFILASLFLIFIEINTCLADSASPFKNLVAQSQKNGRYITPSHEELKKAEKLFIQMFQGDEDNALKKEWSEMGFEWVELHENTKNIIVLREKDNQKLGRGFYAFQKNEKGNILEAPHTFTDLNTGEITAKLFLHYPFSAAAWSTVPRNQVDMSHVSDSYFIAFSRAFALTRPNNFLIQLHGFSQEKRKSISARTADFILSSGNENRMTTLLKMTECLKQNVTPEVRLYGKDVSELGATTNSISILFLKMNHNKNIHIEISKPMRDVLLTNNKILGSFKSCFPN